MIYEFVLDQLFEKSPRTRPMFGCTSVYIGEKIMLILRRKEDYTEDNGVWVCTSVEHHESLRQDFPVLRNIGLFGGGVTAWQNIPESAPEFESTVIAVCERILKGDPRIGKIPERKKRISLNARLVKNSRKEKSGKRISKTSTKRRGAKSARR